MNFDNEIQWCREGKEDESCFSITEEENALLINFGENPQSLEINLLNQTAKTSTREGIHFHKTKLKRSSLADSNPLHVSMRR